MTDLTSVKRILRYSNFWLAAVGSKKREKERETEREKRERDSTKKMWERKWEEKCRLRIFITMKKKKKINNF